MSTAAADRTESQVAADIAQALMHEFDGILPAALVTSVVLQAREDLHGQVVGTALPELLHRLCRVRLRTLQFDVTMRR